MAPANADRIAVEVLLPTPGAFVLGRARLGVDRLTAAGTGVAWVALLPASLDLSIQRGGTRAGIEVGTLALTLLDALDPVESTLLAPNRVVRAYVQATGEALFTGAIQRIRTVHDKAGHYRTSITAVDAVQSLANTIRYGAVVDGGVGFETWQERIRRLSASAQVPVAEPPATRDVPTVVDTWATPNRWFGVPPGALSRIDTMRSGNQRLTVITLYSDTPKPVLEGTAGVEWDLPTIPGVTYTVRLTLGAPFGWARVRLALVGGAVGDLVNVGEPLKLTFTAAGAVSQVRLSFEGFDLLGTRRLRMWDFQMTRRAADVPYRLRDVVYESSLASHFDLACGSVGALWWVDAGGTARFVPDLDAADPVLRFTDDPDDPLADLSYTQISEAYDSGSVLNDLTLSQRGRVWDAEQSVWQADDTTHRFTDETSRATWGSQAGTVETSLWTGAGWTDSLTRRAGEILTASAAPFIDVDSLTYIPTPGLPLPDVHDVIEVTRRGFTHDARVAGITHSISPDRWQTTLTLAPKEQ